MSYKTAWSRAMGLGSAKDGVEHWWQHRVSSVALIPLTIFAVPTLARAIGSGHEAVLATYRSPWNALMLALFILVTFRHLQHGLQSVIEDYVHHKAWRTGLLLGNTWFCGLLGAAGIFAVAKIAFSA